MQTTDCVLAIELMYNTTTTATKLIQSNKQTNIFRQTQDAYR